MFQTKNVFLRDLYMIQEQKFCLMLEEISSSIAFITLRNPNSMASFKE